MVKGLGQGALEKVTPVQAEMMRTTGSQVVNGEKGKDVNRCGFDCFISLSTGPLVFDKPKRH